MVLVLAGGFSGETMAHCVFQILPYLLEVGAVGGVVWALVRLTSGGETLRAYVYKATVQALPGRAVLVMCAAGAGMLGTALCMIVHGTAGRLAGLPAVPFAEGGVWPGHGCRGAMCRPCHGRGRRRRRRTDVFVCVNAG